MKILCTSVGNDGFPAVLDGLQQRAGIHIIGCDADPLAPGLMLADQGFIVPPRANSDDLLAALERIIVDQRVSVFLPLSTEDQPFFAEHRNRIEALGVKLAVSSLSSIKIANDKHAFYEHCHLHGHPIPAFSIVNDKHALLSLLKEYKSRSRVCVLKLSHSTGAQGVKIVDPRLGSEARFWARDNIRVSTEEVIRWVHQEAKVPALLVSDYLPGRHISIDAFRSCDGKFWGVARTEDRHLYGMGTAGVTVNEPDLIKTARRLGDELSLTYCYNVEFKASESGAFQLLEINPRFPASVGHSVAAGLNLGC